MISLTDRDVLQLEEVAGASSEEIHSHRYSVSGVSTFLQIVNDAH